MNFEEFCESPKPEGMTTSGWSEFPLWFASHEECIDNVNRYSMVADFERRHGMESFLLDFADRFPDYELLAIVDQATAEKSDEFAMSSHAEFFFAVDLTSEDEAVLLWTPDSHFESFTTSFAAFLEMLTPWKP